MYQSEEKMTELKKLEAKRQQDEFKAQAYRDANQWRPFHDDNTGQVMFLSELTGELRTGVSNALDWIVQDDGYGFPCFYNMNTGATVHDDPRFTYDIDDDLLQQRKYVMQEMRYALYICKDLWEKYEKALELGDQRQINAAMMKIHRSPKRIHLDGFILRAKALYKQSSVVDKPLNQMAHEEIEYAMWVAAR